MKELWGLRIFIVFLYCISPSILLSKENIDLLQSFSRKDGGANTLYVENKGQIGDQNGKPNPAVKYLILRPGLNIQLKANSFSYDAYTIERFKRVERLEEPLPHKFDKQNDDSLVYHFSRVDIELVDANPNPQITHEGASSDYLNYYTHITSQTKGEDGATGVRGYSTITYHDIYPNIDLEWFLDTNGKPEYQFIINPGGDPSRIRLKYHGAKKTELISDAIHIHTKPGIIKEHIPISYIKESNDILQITFTKTSTDEYGFKIPAYASNETLIIDPMPNRLWGTYYGGSSFDECRSVALDDSNNVYFSGFTSSLNAIASSGAWDSTNAGGIDWGYDTFVAKLSSNGFRVWGTYYGGSGDDLCLSLIIDKSRSVYIGGSTASNSSIATIGAWDETFGGGANGLNYDAFICKFTPNGTRVWGTYVGGDATDYGFSLAKNTLGEIFFCGRTKSSSDIASLGAWDETWAGNGRYDAFLVKFNTSGYRIWGTYYGGLSDDYGIALTCDSIGSIFLCGQTYSTTEIASKGSWDETHGGGSPIKFDAFLVKFSPNGTREWGTYYGGSGDDKGSALAIDNYGFIYLSGDTKSSSDIATFGAWDETWAGNDKDDAFLVKFTLSGSRVWGTYFGGAEEDRGNALGIDRFENVYMCGQTKSSSDIASQGVWDEHWGGFGTDAYFVKFSSLGARKWGTYYGGYGSSYGHAIAINSSENVYIGGVTSSTTEIASTGAWDEQLSGGLDGFVAKFDCMEEKIDQLLVDRLVFCLNESFKLNYTATGNFTANNSFTAKLSDQFGEFKNPTPIGSINSNTSGTINCVIPVNILPGTAYRIRITSTNPSIISSDNGSNLSINTLPQPIISGTISTCLANQLYTYTVPSVAGHLFQWTTPSKGIIIGSKTEDSVKIRWNLVGVDSVKIRQTNSLTGCFNDTTLIVSINSSPLVVINGAKRPCLLNKTDRYSVTAQSGISYQWISPSRGSIVGSDRNNTVDIVWTAPGVDSVRLRTTNTSTGCFSDTSFIVTINPAPSPSISGERALCVSPTTVEYSVKSGATSQYSWRQPKLGMIVGLSDANTVKIRWNTIGFDTLFVRETNTTSGCSKDTFIVVTILPQPQPTISGNSEVLEQEKGLVYSVQLENGSSYEWSIVSGDATITTKSGQLVVVNVGIKGSVILKVVQTNKDGCVNEAQFVITVKSPSGITGEVQSLFSIYPNPTGESNQILIDFTETLHQDISIELLDILGTVHYSNIIQAGSESCRFPIQGMSSGMYVIRIRMNNQVFIEKLIIN